MGEIVNLRKARKAKQHAAAAAQVAANRERHGRTSAEREQQRLDVERAKRELDGANTKP